MSHYDYLTRPLYVYNVNLCEIRCGCYLETAQKWQYKIIKLFLSKHDFFLVLFDDLCEMFNLSLLFAE